MIVGDGSRAHGRLSAMGTDGRKHNVCVITGGGSGMGLATAAIMGRDMRVVIAGRSEYYRRAFYNILSQKGAKARKRSEQ